jgi:transcriptional regulator with XRE-family HTH domain
MVKADPAFPTPPPTRLRAWRLAQKMTMREAAGLGGVTEAYLSLIERGRRTPRPATKLRIARGLGVPVATIFP